MPRLSLICLLAFAMAGCTGTSTPRPAASAPPAELRVMTFNVRYGKAQDGVNHWDHRKELCASRITAFAPDLLGLQETLDFQNAFLLERCPGYAAVGVARDDGKAKGEFSTLLYRSERFTLQDSGTFWLSETPAVVGSKSWDSSLPRIATWARLQDRSAGNRPLLVLNTHFDHKGQQARREAARVIRAFLAEHGKGLPIIVTGDFNATPGSEPYLRMTGTGDGHVVLSDAYAEMHRTTPEPSDNTAHGFTGAVHGRIDWILHTADFRATAATIDRHQRGALFPSDHFPVGAVLSWK
jgi:endonuclease/exonuclease/phosphatase family metal-dependent hydrolase